MTQPTKPKKTAPTRTDTKTAIPPASEPTAPETVIELLHEIEQHTRVDAAGDAAMPDAPRRRSGVAQIIIASPHSRPVPGETQLQRAEREAREHGA